MMKPITETPVSVTELPGTLWDLAHRMRDVCPTITWGTALTTSQEGIEQLKTNNPFLLYRGFKGDKGNPYLDKFRIYPASSLNLTKLLLKPVFDTDFVLDFHRFAEPWPINPEKYSQEVSTFIFNLASIVIHTEHINTFQGNIRRIHWAPKDKESIPQLLGYTFIHGVDPLNFKHLKPHAFRERFNISREDIVGFHRLPYRTKGYEFFEELQQMLVPLNVWAEVYDLNQLVDRSTNIVEPQVQQETPINF